MRNARLVPFLLGSLAVHTALLAPASRPMITDRDGSTLAITLMSSRPITVTDSVDPLVREHRIAADAPQTGAVTAAGPGASVTANDPRATAGSPVSEQTGAQLTQALLEALSPHFRYPVVARQRGWQGEVQIAVRIDADGNLHNIRLARSSGYALLDEAALRSLTRIGRMPQVASWLQGHAFDLRVPVVYRLTRG
jgi:periplasmic protein TonB